MKYYKSIASLKKHYRVGQFGNHFDLGLCQIVGFTTNRRNEAKLEIVIRSIEGLETIAVDNDEVEMKGRIRPSEKTELETYFTE